MVEYANKGSIALLHEGTAVPSVNHESMVPFKSRLLSLRSLGPVDPPNSKAGGVQCQPQTTIPVNLLVQKLSAEQSVSRFSRNTMAALTIYLSVHGSVEGAPNLCNGGAGGCIQALASLIGQPDLSASRNIDIER